MYSEFKYMGGEGGLYANNRVEHMTFKINTFRL